MKEKILTGLKNTAVIIIASFMLLGVIPLGMISHISTVNAEGDFLRLYPETETSLTAGTDQKGAAFFIPENTHAVGENRYGYLRFDIRSLLEKKTRTINNASLRLVFLRTPTTEKVPVQLWLMQTDDWSKSMDWEEMPSRTGDIPIATMTLSPNANGDPQLFEVDLTNYVKKWIGEGRKQVSFRLDSLGGDVSAIYAGSSHEDPVFRPCLKVVTGTAKDPDAKKLQKITLSEKYATTQKRPATATVGEGEEIYLKFSLNTANIQGVIYQARLTLNRLYKDPEALLRIERLENTDWTAESIRQGELPQGRRYLVYREEDVINSDYDNIGLEDVVSDAYAQGKTEIAIVIRSENGNIAFGFDDDLGPEMELLVSDHRDAMAVMETASMALAENTKHEEIITSLVDDRIAENGVRTSVTWSAVDRKTGESAEDVLTSNGKIVRPKWFQDSREIIAKVKVSAGKYESEQIHYLTVLPQEVPSFEDIEFGTMLDIGTSSAEKKGKTETIGTVAESRWVEGRKMTYREMTAEDVVVLHLSVEPEKQNYFTVKLWEEDEFPGIRVSSLQDREQKDFSMTEPQMAVREDGGFCYLTYPIPMAYTSGRSYVSLRLSMIEPEEELEESEASETVDEADESAKTFLYSAYITQTPYFDPMAFADQGEPVVKKAGEESSVYQFLSKIYGAAERTFDFRNATNPEEAMPETEENGVYTDVENREQTTLVFGKEEQLMLEFPDRGATARIYRDTAYYNSYGEMKIKEHYEGELQSVNYGVYRIFRNRGRIERPLPWQEETMAGLYQNLVDGNYYSFLQQGQKIDDSALPKETVVADGTAFMVQPGETVALMLVAEPLYYADYRVSEIDGQAVADVKLKDPLEISSLTLRVMGTVPTQEEKLVIICGVYDRGMLVNLKKQKLTVSPGQVAAELLLEEAVLLQPGHTLKVFVEKQKIPCTALTPVLELPQKQQTVE